MICVIIQARMGSTRLPGKMLMNINGKPLLWHVITRAKKSNLVDKLIVATTKGRDNVLLLKKAKELGVEGFVGNENDVLDRFYQCAKKFKADIIVRITGDCPFIDHQIIDKVIKLFKDKKVDYASNVHPPTYPDGLDVEVFSFKALEKAWKEAKLQSEREHVTPYIWKNTKLFTQVNLKNPEDLSEIRLTIDEPQDIRFTEAIINKGGKDKAFLGFKDIIKIIDESPDLLKINEGFYRNVGYQKSVQADQSAQATQTDGKVARKLHVERGQELYAKAKRLIPGGTQLLSKRPEMFHLELWPCYYRKAKGCTVWDLDDNMFTDMSYMGIGAAILGYADPEVDSAVKIAIDKGIMTTLNCPEEIELAEMLCKLHPWAQMVRYARTGGESMAIAVRIARAKTGKDLVLFCGYHGWHDWYLASNLADSAALDGHLLPGLEPKGVPRALKGTALPFKYNDVSEFMSLINENKEKIAAVVMEPLRNFYPEKGFLEKIRETTKKEGIVLIFDEITSGWRLNLGGAHLLFKVSPDICVFGKGMSNGYPMAALIGTKEVMDAAQTSFISSTYWTEKIGPSAAIATINAMKERKVQEHLAKIGKKVQEGWTELARKHGIKIRVSGIHPLGHFSFEHKNPRNQLVLKTLFTQLMLERGFLATTAFYASFAHKEEHVKKYLEAADKSFELISKAIKEGKPEKYLKGGPCHSGFKRLN